jgi:hypothetical protein
LRTCPVTGRVVLINADWLDRPAPAAAPAGACWYCEATGRVIVRRGDVVARPHPVPALGVEGDPRPAVYGGGVRRQAVGAHELVYGRHLGDDAPLFEILADRVTDLRGDPRLLGFSMTRRHAPGRHVCWHLFAVPYPVPASAPAGWRDHERLHGERVIEDGAATTLLAFAPRVPFEAWVMPAQGLAGFTESGLKVREAVAQAVGRALVRIGRALRNAPIDLVLVDGEPWRVEILPRLTPPAAVETATGVAVHGVFPEEAVAFLREG